MTHIVGHVISGHVAGAVQMVHHHVVRPNRAVVDGHFADARARSTGCGLATGIRGEGTHMSHLAAAIDIASDGGCFAGQVFLCFVNQASGCILRPLHPMGGTNIHIRVAYHICHVTTTIDGTNGADGKIPVASGRVFLPSRCSFVK